MLLWIQIEVINNYIHLKQYKNFYFVYYGKT